MLVPTYAWFRQEVNAGPGLGCKAEYGVAKMEEQVFTQWDRQGYLLVKEET